MIGNKARKALGMMAHTRTRTCGRDACGKPGIGTGSTRCLEHIEQESFKRKKRESVA